MPDFICRSCNRSLSEPENPLQHEPNCDHIRRLFNRRMEREPVVIDMAHSPLSLVELEWIISNIRRGQNVNVINTVAGGVSLAEIYSYLIREGVSLSPME